MTRRSRRSRRWPARTLGDPGVRRRGLRGRHARRTAARLGLGDRVRFLGRQPDEAFADLIAAVDVGVNLRLPPTNGETSAALLELLRAGVPTIITDVGTFSDYSDDVVRKVRWETDGTAGLTRVLRELADNLPARAALGRAAAAYVAERHGWPGAAARYAEVIERCHAHARRRAGADVLLRRRGEP